MEGLSLDDADKMKDKLAMLQDRYNAIRGDCDDHQDKLSVSFEVVHSKPLNFMTATSTRFLSKFIYGNIVSNQRFLHLIISLYCLLLSGGV